VLAPGNVFRQEALRAHIFLLVDSLGRRVRCLVLSVDVCWKAHYLVHVSLVLNQLAVYRHGNRGQQALPKLIIERSFLLVDVVLVTDEARKLVYDVGCEL
jgi:hypothetical protein